MNGKYRAQAVLTVVLIVTAAAIMTAVLARPHSTTLAAAGDPLPVLWTAGGISPGNDGAGQAARIAADPLGNVAVVSGPSLGSQLAVTSYSPSGVFRWRSSVSPSSGVFLGDWIAAAPGGEFVAVGHNISMASGNPIGITIVRFGVDGAQKWRVDLSETLPYVGRLIVDQAGSTYLAYNSIGDGQDIHLQKYDSSGSLIWAQEIASGLFSNDIATSIAFSPDESEVALSGDVKGGSTWIIALFDAGTGTPKWVRMLDEGVATRDIVVDQDRVYVTGTGNVGIAAFLSLVGLDRQSGERLWRTDAKPDDATSAAGLWLAKGQDGRLIAAGAALRGFLDWYIVAFDTDGGKLWHAVRDGGLNTDEVPSAAFFLPNGTAVISGSGGPNLPGGYIPGVTAGYGPGGALLWEGMSNQATRWAVGLPNGDVCAAGGYDALVTCWRTTAWSIWLPVVMRNP